MESRLASGPGAMLGYVYDLGDFWELDVLHEKTLKSTRRELPACTGGARAAPPEDSGGVFGFQEAVIALKRPRSREGREAREILGRRFRPAAFDPKQVRFEMFGADSKRGREVGA